MEQGLFSGLRTFAERTAEQIFYNPTHPYTKALLNSIPKSGKKDGTRLEVIKGTVPLPLDLPEGCPYNPRCTMANKQCRESIDPPVVETEPGYRKDFSVVPWNLYGR